MICQKSALVHAGRTGKGVGENMGASGSSDMSDTASGTKFVYDW